MHRLMLSVQSNDVCLLVYQLLLECNVTMPACRAGLRTLMATGDYHHTALAVARGTGMIPPQGQVVIIQKQFETNRAMAASTPSALRAGAPRRAPKAVAFPHDLCQTSDRAHQGLLFELDSGASTQADALQLLTAVAQVGIRGLGSRVTCFPCTWIALGAMRQNGKGKGVGR